MRADLLPPADAARVRELLSKYLDPRVLFYETRDEPPLPRLSLRKPTQKPALQIAGLS